MWVIMGYDSGIRFNRKFSLSSTIAYEFMGSGP